MLQDQIKLYFDGSKKDETIKSAYIICTDIEDENTFIRTGESIFYSSKYTSSYAEYTALLHGLIECLALNILRIKIYGDDKGLIDKVKEGRTSNSNLKAIHTHICFCLSKFNHVEWEWIPRDQNQVVDRKTK